MQLKQLLYYQKMKLFLHNKSLKLWREITKGNPKSHNYQMDVVLALWNNDMVNTFVTSK
ncbi:DUF6979 family protein [Paenibacillus odorifer]|uniref:DUF6979 family protein n=1 Tax=Paenibacillus TaxID=44249 RepID=UPI003F827D12